LDCSQDEYTADSIMEDGNIIRILNMKDDSGHPFLEFEWNGGWSGCSPSGAALIAKRETKGAEWTGLSDSERRRLGIGMTGQEVMATKEKDGDLASGSESEPTIVANPGVVGEKRKLSDALEVGDCGEEEQQTKKLKAE